MIRECKPIPHTWHFEKKHNVQAATDNENTSAAHGQERFV